MNYPNAQQARLSYLEPAHAMNERSAFVYAAEFCNHFMPEPAEIKVLTTQPWSLRTSIFWMGADATVLLGQALGIDSKTWIRAVGRDIVGSHAARSILLAELRHCPECLLQGWHSALHQHSAVERCPAHNAALQTGCPHCGASISTTMAAIAKNHFYCGECQRSLAGQRRRAGLGKPVLQISARQFEPMRLSLLDTGASDIIRSPLTLSQPPDVTVRTPGGPRALAHHLQWPDATREMAGRRVDRQDRQISVTQETALVPQPQQQRRLRATALAAMEDILEIAQHSGPSIDIPPELSSIGKAAARVNIRVGLIAAALWRTARIFEVDGYLLGELPPRHANEQPLSREVPPYEPIDTEIRKAQVAAVFVDSVLQLRRCQYGVQINWSESAVRQELMPAWRGFVHEGQIEMRVRVRCGMALVGRVARRYRSSFLSATPEGVAPQELLAQGSTDGVRSDARAAL